MIRNNTYRRMGKTLLYLGISIGISSQRSLFSSNVTPRDSSMIRGKELIFGPQKIRTLEGFNNRRGADRRAGKTKKANLIRFIIHLDTSVDPYLPS
jgi:hypothetical protein